MQWFEAHQYQIAALLAAGVILALGRRALLPKAKRDRFLLWVAWIVTLACGLILGYALAGVATWLTSLNGTLGGVVGSVGAIAAVILGWYSDYLIIACVKDLVDGKPDEEARKAALWVPTFLPAGWSATWGIVLHPRGLGTGVTAVAIAVVTIVFTHKIVKSVLAAQKARTFWRWYAAAVCLLAGIVTVPLLLFADAQASRYLAGTSYGWLITIGHIVAGAAGVALLVAALVDIRDKVPDAYVRAFLRFGLPILIVFGAVAVSALSGDAHSTFGVVRGSVK